MLRIHNRMSYRMSLKVHKSIINKLSELMYESACILTEYNTLCYVTLTLTLLNNVF